MSDEDERKAQQERADAIRKQIEELKKRHKAAPPKPPTSPREFIDEQTHGPQSDDDVSED